MKKLPALAGALALLIPAAQAGAQTYHPNTAEQRLVNQIVHHRNMTWHWQDRAHHKRLSTQHRERVAGVSLLARLSHYWEHRHYLAWKAWTRYKKSEGPVIDSCIRALIEREGSNWNPRATNPSTGAYGLPQALPGEKMASAGKDWATNPATQIRWMIGYVSSRYGGSCAALQHSYANGWY